MNDGLANSNVATTTIHVTAVDDLPFATADNVITNFGTGTVVPIPSWALLANDQDLDNPLSVTSVSGATGGTASLGGGVVTFNDTGGSGGSFNYTATGGSLTTTAQVTVSQDTSGAMDGTSGDDILIAKAGAATMNGNGGNDVLIGNTGSQIMNGGPGSDTFVFKAIANSTPAAFDTIQDFTPGVDHLDFTTIPGTTNLHAMTNATDSRGKQHQLVRRRLARRSFTSTRPHGGPRRHGNPPDRLEHQPERQRHSPSYIAAIGYRAACDVPPLKSATSEALLTLPSRLRRQNPAFVSYLMSGALILGYSGWP